jgi:two-component system OmpR family response regulator
LEKRQPDVAIVDLALGKDNGLDFVRLLQSYPQTGIIILSGKGDTIDRVVGLEIGADDYMTKPFDTRELLARVRGSIRRTARLNALNAALPMQTSNIHFEGWRLNRTARALTSPQGDDVPLTTIEFEMLSVLCENAGSPISRDRLYQVATGNDSRTGYDRSVDVHIANLRKKLEADAATPQIIKTVRGVGYVVAASAELG